MPQVNKYYLIGYVGNGSIGSATFSSDGVLDINEFTRQISEKHNKEIAVLCINKISKKEYDLYCEPQTKN